MFARDKSKSFVVVLTILLLLNLSFSLFARKFYYYQNSDDAVGLSGPIVSFAQSVEVVIVATIKRVTSRLGLRLTNHKSHKEFVLLLSSLSFVFVFSSHCSIFKTVQNLKLEGG